MAVSAHADPALLHSAELCGYPEHPVVVLGAVSALLCQYRDDYSGGHLRASDFCVDVCLSAGQAPVSRQPPAVRNVGTTNFIFDEQKKTLAYALSQITASGLARAGVSAAVSVLMLLVPVTIFIITQSNIIETMSTSGMKE